MPALISSHPSLHLMDPRSEIKASQNNTQSQRSGYQVDPYDGAYPMMGRIVKTPNPYDGLGLRLFGMGLIRPFTQGINAGIRTVDYATSSVNQAFITLLGAGGVALLIKAFREKAALRPALGLVALGAATYFGVKALVKGVDGQRTQLQDGDWQYRLGTTATYGAGAAVLLGLFNGGNIAHIIKDAASKALDGTKNVLPTLLEIIKKPFK